MTDTSAGLEAFFNAAEYDAETFERFSDLVFESSRARARFEEMLQAYRGGGDPLRVGIGLHLLGRHREALEALAKAPAGKFRHYYAGLAAAAIGRHEQAAAEFQEAAARGWDAFECDVQIAMVRIEAGQVEAAEKLLSRHERGGADRAEWYCARGMALEARGEREAALEAQQRALKLNPDLTPALFRAALLYDRLGEDARAVEVYEQLAAQPRAHVNALINLAVLYEDRGYFENAGDCLRRVLADFPNHTRARLFLKDVISSQSMVIDETGDRKTDTRSRMLETPITEFDLSVRARNCLKKMKIHTLGDLLKLTEAELLAYKNFGESSLAEIKALLARKGLRLGQPAEEIDTAALVEVVAPRPAVPPGSEGVLSKLVSELEFSVRARRCLQRLNINTVGDLIQHSEAELLATRNFGQTSLNEIRARLADFGLSLAAKR